MLVGVVANVPRDAQPVADVVHAHIVDGDIPDVATPPHVGLDMDAVAAVVDVAVLYQDVADPAGRLAADGDATEGGRASDTSDGDTGAWAAIGDPILVPAALDGDYVVTS